MAGRSRCFCTIITHSHLGWALALLDSLRQFQPELPFYILVTDNAGTAEDARVKGKPGVHVLQLKDLLYNTLGAAIAQRYAQQRDELRWSMKGVLMEHLLCDHEHVIYGDCDLHFFQDPAWLYDELATSNVLLTPHWRSSHAGVDRDNFDMLFLEGLYNAGFVAAGRGGIPALRRWAENCLVVCVKDTSRGQHDDQAHLNILPIYFEGVQVLKHRGCNVANWNLVECARTQNAAGEVLIADRWPVVFIHFTRSMIDGIMSGKDPYLLPQLRALRDRLLANGQGTDIIAVSEQRLKAKQAVLEEGLSSRIKAAINRVVRPSGS